MKSAAATVEEYLAGLPRDRREAMTALREFLRENLPKGYEEGMAYGMIGYGVPHDTYPAGYHCDPKQPVPFASIASQKNHMALYLFCLYGDPEYLAWFRDAWRRSGKKLDMGKSCVRFRRLEDVPLDVVGKAIGKVPVQRFLAWYESRIKPGGPATRKKAQAVRKVVARKAAKKRVAKKK